MCATTFGFVVVVVVVLVVVVVSSENQIHICRLVLQLLLPTKPSSWPLPRLIPEATPLGGGLV